MSKRIPALLTAGVVLSSLFLGFVRTVAVKAQSAGNFITTANMTTPRDWHTATLLTDGKVLIAGGRVSFPFGGGAPSPGPPIFLASTELYDPHTATFTVTGSMARSRAGHSATLLRNGKVLVAGGFQSSSGKTDVLIGAELYDPATQTFTATGDMRTASYGHTATLLANGNVLIASVPRAEVYDPDTGSFAVTGYYADPNIAYVSTSTLLPDGKVLITAGSKFAERNQLYDPESGAFSLVGPISPVNYRCCGVYNHTATLLMNGKVLVAGGGDDWDRFADAELYDPAVGSFSRDSFMTAVRCGHTATLLPAGTVLITGGESTGPIITSFTSGGHGFIGSLASAELYDGSAGSFIATGPMITRRSSHVATLLSDGQVLITGGVSYEGLQPNRQGLLDSVFWGSLASAELYQPAVSVPPLVVHDLRFNQRSAAAGTSYSLEISGFNLTPQRFFDIRFRAPGSNVDQEAMNWQTGGSASHIVPFDTATGVWTITGVRPHQVEADHTGDFTPLNATITVSP